MDAMFTCFPFLYSAEMQYSAASSAFKCSPALSLQMTNPAIQNDFSYYRRTLSRMRIANQTVSKPALYGNVPHYYQTPYVLVIPHSPVS